MINKAIKKIDVYSDYLVWLVAVTGLFGSLYFSEVEKLAPCSLCWWQRVLLYPFVAIYAVAILRKDKISAAYYGLPLSIIGMIIAFYQSLLQWGILKESTLTCSATSPVSCGDVQFEWLGFITIPFMSFLAFSFITIMLGLRVYLIKKSTSKSE
jgi:disulfide bond formation protein DsbB